MTIYVYDEHTRMISFTYDAPYPPGYEELLESHGLKWVEGDARTDIQDIYVGEDLMIRPLKEFQSSPDKTTIESDGQDAAKWTALPRDTQIWVDGQHLYSGTSFELESTDEGIYRVELRKTTYRTKVFWIEVV